ncbi:DUF6800 family protein [Patescibacteria group bacterium]
MGRDHSKKRQMTIRQKQKRRQKLAKLRSVYVKSDSSSKKEQILEKVLKIAPKLSPEEFLKSLKPEKTEEKKEQ